MAGRIDVWPGFVNRGMYDESGSIDNFICSSNLIAFFVHLHHVGDRQKPEVHSVRIYPECVGSDRVCMKSMSKCARVK